MTKKWMEVKSEIERLYLIQRNPLEEVRQQMLKEHGFAASARVYKDKFKEWGWKTYKKACNQNPVYVKNRVSRSRPCRKPSSLAMSVRAGLKNPREDIKRQRTLVMQERTELRALHRSIEDEQSDRATAKRVNKLISKIAVIEETVHELRRYIEGIETRRNAPRGFASCWKQDPMILEDALGRLLLIPLEIVVSWEIFEEHLRSLFQVCPGAKKVQKREYAIEDRSTRTAFSKNQPWSLFSVPGRKVEMSMIFKDRSKTSVVCPKCDTISDEKKGILIECKNSKCKMLFRTEDEEDQPAQQARPKAFGYGKIAISLGVLTDAPEDEEEGEEEGEEEEDQLGLFKRVIIRIAKLPRHAQYTAMSSLKPSHGTDPLLPLSDIGFPVSSESWVEPNPSHWVPSGLDATLLDWGAWDDFLSDSQQHIPSIDYPQPLYGIHFH
ncbi:Clr5 domain-containing protein [Bisporella sp. PMI_857]|nr:Clr5 domain-containing protein [Bisporella sp. PMI_857]